MTSNPSIFEKAIAAGNAYDEQIQQLAPQGQSAGEIFEASSVQDVQEARDLFRPLHDRSAGLDGMVSLEVSPGLARDAHGTVIEGRGLWAAVDRPNVLIKVPGTEAGIAATSLRRVFRLKPSWFAPAYRARAFARRPTRRVLATRARVAALARAVAAARSADERVGRFDLHALDLPSATADSHDFVERSTHILDQVEPVPNLHGVGRTTSSSIGERSAAITDRYRDTGKRLSPFNGAYIKQHTPANPGAPLGAPDAELLRFHNQQPRWNPRSWSLPGLEGDTESVLFQAPDVIKVGLIDACWLYVGPIGLGRGALCFPRAEIEAQPIHLGSGSPVGNTSPGTAPACTGACHRSTHITSSAGQEGARSPHICLQPHAICHLLSRDGYDPPTDCKQPASTREGGNRACARARRQSW